ncbi:similar to Saccharomyces cerevisiae YBR197C Putative protein of unknown function [Maudiozyma saulgeensis]|uniref:Uncharacterized protein n=1 Tax=Maudiozyma saulgeensis TaxID=1789683 RepID=A0A1X7R6Z0_9SACH|nr:similar to Saccharomyces cerevisiae YBR197C Putative protein of unknown function [Kazachstania saulgeensis]
MLKITSTTDESLNKMRIPKNINSRTDENEYDEDEYYLGEDEQRDNTVNDIPRTLPITNIYSDRYRTAHKLGGSSAGVTESDVHSSSNNDPYRKRSTSTYSRNSNNPSNVYRSIKHGISGFNKAHESYPSQNNVRDTRRLVTAPAIDSQERLRSQLTILQDVQRVADHENIYDGFPIGLENKLVSLRNAHSKLLLMLRERTAKIEEQKRHDINATVLANIPSTVTSNSAREDTISNVISTSINGKTATVHNNITGAPYVRTKSTAYTVNPEEKKYIQQLVDITKELR